MYYRKISAVIIIFTLSLASVLIFNSGCFISDDETRVTINLQRNDLGFNNYIPEKRLIDRILEFFATRAEAVTAQLWSDVKGDMTLTISSSSFDNKVFDIPASTTSYTVIIPAVSNVTFTLVTSSKNWGGHSTVSLAPGEQELLIKMIPMVAFWNKEGSYPSYNLHFYTFYDDGFGGTPPPTPGNVDGFYIYRASDINGQYAKIATENINSTFFTEIDALETGSTYYYKISVFGCDGEGVLSDSYEVLIE